MASLQLQVTVENLAPDRGIGHSPVWVGLHDGSFDPVNVGDSASDALELLAEDGFVGLEEIELPGILEAAIAAGLDVTELPAAVQAAITLGLDLSTLPPPSGTWAGDFLASPAGTAGGTQGMVVTSIRSNPSFFDLLDDPSTLPQEVLDSVDIPYFFIQAPGETESTRLTLNGTPSQNRYLSYASMLFPTNDGFVANDDPKAIEVFDEDGNFLGADFMVLGSQALDAGTEVNDEDPMNLLYTFEAFANSEDEDGTIQAFPGFLASGAGGALDFTFNGQLVSENADFTAPGYEMMRISVSAIYKGDEESNTFQGGVWNDRIFGKRNDDILSGGDGDDLLRGGAGADTLRGNAGNDTLRGGTGNDLLLGGRDDDILFGNGGDDVLKGNRGNDILDGGRGSNRLKGGRGEDGFVLRRGGGRGFDTIVDFRDGQDVFLLAGNLNFGQLMVDQNGNRAEISLISNGRLLASVIGVNANALGADDFIMMS